VLVVGELKKSDQKNKSLWLQVGNAVRNPLPRPDSDFSDEESGFNDAEDDEADVIDDLPPIADIISKIEDEESERVDTASEHSPSA
jgi:hypothetical protein